MMVISGFLEDSLHIGCHENVVSYLKPGHEAANLLNGRGGPVNLLIKTKPKVTRKNQPVDKNLEACLTDLTNLCNNISKQLNISNPEIVFRISTIHKMVNKSPATKEDFLNWKESLSINGQNFKVNSS